MLVSFSEFFLTDKCQTASSQTFTSSKRYLSSSLKGEIPFLTSPAESNYSSIVLHDNCFHSTSTYFTVSSSLWWLDKMHSLKIFSDIKNFSSVLWSNKVLMTSEFVKQQINPTLPWTRPPNVDLAWYTTMETSPAIVVLRSMNAPPSSTSKPLKKEQE